jgi:outer membrane murein-binding lipoprotein Lpp
MADRWVTYAELAELMGCPSGAARARAVRRRWRRQIGNDGLARVLVPDGEDLSPKWTPTVRLNDSETTAQTDSPPSAPTTPPPRDHDAELMAKLERLQAELVEMARKLGAAEADVTSAKGLVEELRQDRDAWRAQIERARSEAEQARSELAAYRARPWWRRAFG